MLSSSILLVALMIYFKAKPNNSPVAAEKSAGNPEKDIKDEPVRNLRFNKRTAVWIPSINLSESCWIKIMKDMRISTEIYVSVLYARGHRRSIKPLFPHHSSETVRFYSLCLPAKTYFMLRIIKGNSTPQKNISINMQSSSWNTWKTLMIPLCFRCIVLKSVRKHWKEKRRRRHKNTKMMRSILDELKMIGAFLFAVCLMCNGGAQWEKKWTLADPRQRVNTTTRLLEVHQGRSLWGSYNGYGFWPCRGSWKPF